MYLNMTSDTGMHHKILSVLLSNLMKFKFEPFLNTFFLIFRCRCVYTMPVN